MYGIWLINAKRCWWPSPGFPPTAASRSHKSESSVVKSNYSSPWSTSQKSNKNLSKIFKNVRRHSKEWKGVSIIYLASSIIKYVGQGNRCQDTNAKMFPRRNVSPLSREVVAGIRESSLVPVQSGSLLSWQSGTINDNCSSRANTSLHGIAGMLLKLIIWKL